MDFRGKIDMKNPEITIVCFEECTLAVLKLQGPHVDLLFVDESRPAPANGPPRKRCENDGRFREVFFGRLVRPYSSNDRKQAHSAIQIAEGTARQLIGVFDVKKRVYFGNTSMEAEISLLMANQTLVGLRSLPVFSEDLMHIEGISWKMDI